MLFQKYSYSFYMCNQKEHRGKRRLAKLGSQVVVTDQLQQRKVFRSSLFVIGSTVSDWECTSRVNDVKIKKFNNLIFTPEMIFYSLHISSEIAALVD